jgi:hypothetical protein
MQLKNLWIFLSFSVASSGMYTLEIMLWEFAGEPPTLFAYISIDFTISNFRSLNFEKLVGVYGARETEAFF